MGWENIFHCEWNEFGQKVLNHYWPKAISYDDITKTDFTIHRGRIDILTGGFPCQPYSQAGKRLGKEDDRHLWPEMLRAVREIKPTYVVGENVIGLTNWNGGLVFEEVQTELEAQGYEIQPFILPAAGVNAPHRRDRVWFVAKNTNKDGWRGYERKEKSSVWKQRDSCTGNNEWLQADNEKVGTSTYTDGAKQTDNGRTDDKKEREVRRDEKSDVLRELSSDGDVADTDNERCKRNRTQPKPKEQKQTGTGYWDDVRKNTWKDFPTVSPILSGDDGLSERLDGITFPKWRNESIKAAGNAIVPQVAYQIFKVINQVN